MMSIHSTGLRSSMQTYFAPNLMLTVPPQPIPRCSQDLSEAARPGARPAEPSGPEQILSPDYLLESGADNTSLIPDDTTSEQSDTGALQDSCLMPDRTEQQLQERRLHNFRQELQQTEAGPNDSWMVLEIRAPWTAQPPKYSRAIFLSDDTGETEANARRLYEKHAQESAIYRWNGSNFDLVYGLTMDGQIAKVLLLGHSGCELSRQTMELINKLRNSRAEPDKLSIVACNAADTSLPGQPSPVEQIFHLFKQQYIEVTVSGHTGQIRINNSGQRVVDSLDSRKVTLHAGGEISVIQSRHVAGADDPENDWLPKPGEIALAGRKYKTVGNITQPKGKQTGGYSSYPHITLKTSDRAEHLTDVRRVGLVLQCREPGSVLHTATSGPNVPTGPTGSNGPARSNGPTGQNETNGPTGLNGPTGSYGPNLQNGPTGPDGPNGTAGATGTRAASLLAGGGEPESDSVPVQRYIIMERFHQDNVESAIPQHDRYIAVEEATGVHHKLKVELNENKHQPHVKTLPARGMSLAKTGKAFLRFTVDGPDPSETGRNLSPRTRARQVGDNGYV